jgi:long-chain acyl-CoA synthetase
LRDRGVQPGDRVALLIGNDLDFPRAYFGVLAAGAVVVPINPLLTNREVTAVLAASEARLLIAGEEWMQAATVAAEAAGVPMLVCSAIETTSLDVDQMQKAAVLGRASDTTVAWRSRSGDDPAVILYSSGSIGRPRGVVLTHLNIRLNTLLEQIDVFRLSNSDVVLTALPPAHCFGQNCVLNAGLRAGATLVLMPRFDVGEALTMMYKYSVSVFFGVPMMYHGLLEAVARGAIAHPLRMAVSSGASLSAGVMERFRQFFGTEVREG